MTFLKQFITFIVLFVFLFVVVYLGTCVVGGAISGGMAGAGNHDPQAAAEAGQRAGAAFVRDHIKAIVLGSFLASLIGSAALSFTGILPWCKRPAPMQPPPL